MARTAQISKEKQQSIITKEESELLLLQMIRSLPASEIAAQINASQSSSNRLAWAKKHEQWTLDRWKSVLWSDESKCMIFGSNFCAL